MRKTGSEVEKDIYRLVKNSGLENSISGKIYRDGTRLPNSKAEDCVVIFITALDGEVQKGVVSINTYIPDVSYGSFSIKNTKRCEEIELLLRSFVESLPTDSYLFSLGQMINTFEEKDISQHFVNIKINFKFNTLN